MHPFLGETTTTQSFGAKMYALNVTLTDHLIDATLNKFKTKLKDEMVGSIEHFMKQKIDLL